MVFALIEEAKEERNYLQAGSVQHLRGEPEGQ